MCCVLSLFFFFKQKTAYEMRISDWSSDVCSSDLHRIDRHPTMSRHPVTPMHEADLRSHFAQLGAGRVGSVDYRTCAAGHQAIQEIGRASCRERVWRYV